MGYGSAAVERMGGLGLFGVDGVGEMDGWDGGLLGFVFSFPALLLFLPPLTKTEQTGYATPPMRGDLEAQRHWLALTSSSLNAFPHVPFLPFLKLYNPPYPSSNISLSPAEWYFYAPTLTTPGPEGEGEVKPYWSLDYPPLTAYHSFFLGFVARLSPITARYVTLRPSAAEGEQKLRDWEEEMRRLESEGGLKNWMRGSVVVGDLVVWATAVLAFCGAHYKKGGRGEEGKAKRRMVRLPFPFFSFSSRSGKGTDVKMA